MKTLLFVVGHGRSGTTMMGRIVGRHSAALMLHEVHFFEELWDPAEGNGCLSHTNAIKLASRLLCTQREGYLSESHENTHHDEAVQIVQRVGSNDLTATGVFREFLLYEGGRANATVVCEQTPRNLYYVDEILALYPEALIVEMIRDPRDVLVSMKNKWRRKYLSAGDYPLNAAFRSWVNYHPIVISRFWSSAARKGKDLSQLDRVIRVNYEQLASAAESEIKRVCSFGKLEFEADMINVPHVGSSTSSDSGDIGISSSGIGRWRNGNLSNTELWLCQKIAGKEMKDAGYELEVVRIPLFGVALSIISLPVKMTMALVMNFHRARNIRLYIMRRLRT